ncbi:MAG TPA: GNAT family N-acetyltransferase [Anaerolineales bacterium]|nr:GNAT family N-acetyltransferase [Anaerolineales bacterium]
MLYDILPLSQISDCGLEELAKLHIAVMHTLLTDLGLPFVRRYYQIAKTSASVIGYYALSSDGIILGWVIGSPHPDKVNAELRTPFSWFVRQLFRLALTDPLTLWRLRISIFPSPNQTVGQNSIELTYLGVSQTVRGQGVGQALLKNFVQAGSSARYRSIVLSVEKDNQRALALYSAMGFHTIRTFAEGHFERLRMELVL